MADYDVLTYERPDGMIINLSNDPYMLDGHDGFGISEFTDTTVDPPGLHGSYWYDTRMNAKVVTIYFTYFGDGVIERQSARRDIVRLFNPLLGPGIMRLEQVNGSVRELRCKLAESMPLPTDDFVGSGGQRFTARFKSDGIPALYDPTVNVLPFAASMSGNFSFPWSFPRVFAQSGYFNILDVTNIGDIETPVAIHLVGPLSNPIIRNDTTNEQISLNGITLGLNETLDINTDPGNTIVKINGIDAWQYVRDANFWELARGDNHIVLDIGSTNTNTSGTLTWYTRYIGQ